MSDPAISAAAKIDGWMYEKELEWLYYAASTRRTIVEIGSWKGRSTKALADATWGKVYAIDHWKGSDDELMTYQREAALIGPDKMFAQFSKNLASEISSKKVIPIRADSVEAVKILTSILDAPVDMVFIDGGHKYETSKHDIVSYRSLIRSGGLLCGHDREHPGVAKALSELVPLTRHCCGIWYVTI